MGPVTIVAVTALVFGLPWLLLLASLVVAVILSWDLPEPNWFFVPGFYVTVCAGVSILGWWWARDRVLTELRTAAAGALAAGGGQARAAFQGGGVSGGRRAPQ